MAGPWGFAWCGGLIEEQQTVVTTGSTHGGQFEAVSIAGDVTAGSQIMRLAQSGKLTEGALYTLSGPGVGAATIYDTTISAPGALTMSQPAGATAHSATYIATRAQSLGLALVTFTAGSESVAILSFSGTLAPGGTYSISAYPVGDAGDKPVTTAYLDWDGSVGTMYVAVAPEAGGVEGRPVTATASGDFWAEISGFASGDDYSVTGIPSSALSSLTEGLIYNISGNGIAAGTTFIAPASGATEITLDQPGSATLTNSLLTITGPRTPNEPWDAAVHARFDEDVLSVEIAQSEGDFATLTVELKNPGIGLLAAGRNLWCWLSWDQAWPDGTPDPVPLFNGRLVGVPRLTAGEVVQLQFLARPDDYAVQKASIADGLQVLPYYDPVWISSAVTADTTLETYSALWHIDRTTLELSVSDIIQGEAGTVTVGEDVALYDNFSLSYGQPPLASVTVSGTVSWDQQASGSIDITETILDAFRSQGGAPYGRTLASTKGIHTIFGYRGTWPNHRPSGGGLIQVLSGDGMLNAWPKGGTEIGAGWSFPNGNDAGGKPLNFIEEATANNKGGWLPAMNYNVKYASNTIGAETQDNTYSDSVTQVIKMPHWQQLELSFPVHTLWFRSVVEYKANRRRTETVYAVMTADVQRQLSDTADQDQEAVTLTSDTVGQGVEEGGGVPIGSLAFRSYFQTERGARSFEYLLLAARAKLRARARSVEVTFAVPWGAALGIGLKHSVTLLDRRLPGGSATGKVKSYTLRAHGGIQVGEFVIGCTIGNGTPSSPAAGVPIYVEEAYVEPGWQVYAGAQYPLLEDEFAYETLDGFMIDDDGVNLTNLTRQTAVNYCTVINGMVDQVGALGKFQNKVSPFAGLGDPLSTMQEMQTDVTLDLVPLTGAEFHSDFFPALTQLSLPKTIDLAAES